MEQWETKSDNFLLAYHVLTDRPDEAAAVMRRIGKAGHGIDKSTYQEWPIFREVAKTNEFRSAFLEIYGEDYERKNMDYILRIGDVRINKAEKTSATKHTGEPTPERSA